MRKDRRIGRRSGECPRTRIRDAALRSHISVSTAALILVVRSWSDRPSGNTSWSCQRRRGSSSTTTATYRPTRPSMSARHRMDRLAVYVIVMLAVASVVASLDSSRIEAKRATRRRTASQNSPNTWSAIARRRLAQDHRVGGPRRLRGPRSLDAGPRRGL